MGGSSGSGNQTVTNRTEIDPVTQQWRSAILGAGTGLYNQGTQPYYPGSTVVPFSDPTQSGLNYLQGYAQNGATNLGAANNANLRAMQGQNPGMYPAMYAAMGGLNNNPATQGLSQYGDAQNPHLRGLFDQGAEMVGNAVNSQFAQAGRYGANAAHTGALTREMGNLYNQIYAPAYEAERNRGLTAQQTMGSLFDSGQNRQLAGIGLLGDMYSQGNQDAARAIALQPSLYQYGAMPGDIMMGVGGAYEGLANDYLQSDMSRYYSPYNQAWDHLRNYSGLMSGLPDFSGSTSTSQGPGTNRFMAGLGGAATGAGIASALGASGWGLPLALIGGGLGLFG